MSSLSTAQIGKAGELLGRGLPYDKAMKRAADDRVSEACRNETSLGHFVLCA